MDRRDFIKLIGASIAALHLPAMPASGTLKNGIEILRDTQPPGADYYQICVIAWDNGQVKCRESAAFICTASREVPQDYIDYRISETIARVKEMCRRIDHFGIKVDRIFV